MQRDPVCVGPLSLVLIVCNPRRRFAMVDIGQLGCTLYKLGVFLCTSLCTSAICNLDVHIVFVTVPIQRISKSKLLQCESDFVAGIESRLKVLHYQGKSAQ